MATEPSGTSKCYVPTESYTPPVGRLLVLGKARAQIDLLRAQMADALNTIVVRNAAQTDNHDKITGELAALATQTINDTNKINGELTALIAQTTNDTTRATNDTTRATNDTTKITGELSALVTQTTNDTTKTTNDTTRTHNDTTQTESAVEKANAEIAALQIKSAAEVTLLEQKAVTELAQTSETIPIGAGLNTASEVGGIIDKQKTLFTQQANGFSRDAEQKLAKIMVDSWSVRQTVGDTTASGPAKLGDADIASVITKAIDGLAVT